MAAVITASNVLCAGGRGTEQLWATVRAGISCIRRSSVIDRNFDAISMGLVPEDALPPLPPELESKPLPASVRRMLRLAAPTLSALLEDAGVQGTVSVFLGLPELDPSAFPWGDDFMRHLASFANKPVDLELSRIFPAGRAAALKALEAALVHLTQSPGAAVVVGGVDTFFNARRIAQLDFEQRILGPQIMDGFIPGEGAAFYILMNEGSEAGGSPAVKIQAAASSEDPGHRYGTDPALGQGLGEAIDKLRAELSGTPRVRNIFAAFNGENFEAKLWGVARLRHSDFFLPDAIMQHPADCIGDSGAASGALLVALAAHALSSCQREGSTLVWAASDREPRACALLNS
jgi:3-oxoacyl-[acyl-carrier-protein] synthase-1